MKHEAQAHIRDAVFVAYVALVLALLFAPVGGPAVMRAWPIDADKLAHLALMSGIGFLEFWRARGTVARRIMAGTGWAVALAAATELVQTVLPYRSGDGVDFMAGAVGGVAGASLAAGLRRVTIDRRMGRAG